MLVGKKAPLMGIAGEGEGTETWGTRVLTAALFVQSGRGERVFIKREVAEAVGLTHSVEQQAARRSQG